MSLFDREVPGRRIWEEGAGPTTLNGQRTAPSGDGFARETAPDADPVTATDADHDAATLPSDATTDREPVIAVRNLTKTYRLGRTRVPALRGVSLEVAPGEFVAVMGPSGSGKSTFMNLLGCLDSPTSGEYRLMGVTTSKMAPDELASVRNRRIGFVFQGFNLLARATALANVALPMVYRGWTKDEQERRATRALRLVGLGGRLGHKPAELSGGQQQRVAIARALVNGPALLLADEPTGNLDSRTSIEIMALLQALNERGLTIVLVTHEPDIAAYAQRQISFRDGRVTHDTLNAQPRSARAEWARLARAGAHAQSTSGNGANGGNGAYEPTPPRAAKGEPA